MKRKTHYRGRENLEITDFYKAACGWQTRSVPSTSRWSKVTCERCLQKKGKEVN